MSFIFMTAAILAICPAQGARSHCVHDGDTVWLEGEKIRLEGIDTPELNGQCDYEKRLAIRARNRLVVLLNAGPYRISRNGEDRYGRTLATITVNGRRVGDILIQEKLARRWTGRREPWCG